MPSPTTKIRVLGADDDPLASEEENDRVGGGGSATGDMGSGECWRGWEGGNGVWVEGRKGGGQASPRRFEGELIGGRWSQDKDPPSTRCPITRHRSQSDRHNTPPPDTEYAGHDTLNRTRFQPRSRLYSPTTTHPPLPSPPLFFPTSSSPLRPTNHVCSRTHPHQQLSGGDLPRGREAASERAHGRRSLSGPLGGPLDSPALRLVQSLVRTSHQPGQPQMVSDFNRFFPCARTNPRVNRVTDSLSLIFPRSALPSRSSTCAASKRSTSISLGLASSAPVSVQLTILIGLSTASDLILSPPQSCRGSLSLR